MRNYILLCLVTVAVFAAVGCSHLRWQTPSIGFDFTDWQLNLTLGLPLPIWEPDREVAYESPFQVQSGGVQEPAKWKAYEPTGYSPIIPAWHTTEGYESKIIYNTTDYDLVDN